MSNKFWKQLMGGRSKEATYYERAKKSKKQLDKFAGSMGITIYTNWIPGRYGLLDALGHSIHNDYGVRDCPYNLKEVEQCLEDYRDSREK